jgi:2-oxoglutarate ferredoxin oxidoreductase subunit beta
VKLANPSLDVWVVGGDGDFLSIGGNHLLHVLRRDVDLNLLLLNNAIYGLTKGQYSPTSPIGTRSPSSPGGSVERPVNAALFALGSGASFVARSVDSMQDHMPGILVSAHAHKGASLVEILQNCIIYHDGAFGPLGEKATAAEAGIRLVHGEPMLFGKNKEKGLVFDADTSRFRVVGVGTEVPLEAVARHDETNLSRAIALANLGGAGEPTALGVLYARTADGGPAGFADLQPTPAMTRDQLASLLSPRSAE